MSSRIEVFSNDRLSKAIAQVSKFEPRDMVQSIVRYLQSDCMQVLALYGLRRTGKTISMLHTISRVGIEKCVYINCFNDSSFDELVEIIRGFSDKFIFIDEITNCDTFSDDASMLSTLFTECGTKIVIAGTDSLRINLASRTELLGRLSLINTVHCPYYEYKRLHKEATVDEYLMTGTVHQPETFLTLSNCEKYIDDAIINNIWSTLNKTEDVTGLSILRQLDESTLSELVYRCIDKISTLCAETTLRKVFKEAGISAATKKITPKVKHTYSTRVGFTTCFRDNTLELSIAIRKLLEFLGVTASVKEYDFSINAIVERGVLLMPGMQYRLVAECLKIFQEDNPGVISDEKVYEVLLGILLEDTIVYHTYNAIKVKFDGGEFDMLTADKSTNTCVIYEIKHSSEIVSDQQTYLNNDTFIQAAESKYGVVVDKVVLYNGATVRLGNGILYKNIEEYLLGK